MFKSPRRNGRNKGFKIKHVIQISMLLGVSIWLVYQIHRSDDKKPSVTNKISQKLENDGSKEIFKFGRKVLRPKVKGTESDDEQKNEMEGSEDAKDCGSEKNEKVGENEHANSKEDSEEMKEHENENEKDDDDKGHEQTGKIQMKEKDGNKNDNQNQVVVMEKTEKKMSPSLKEVETENDKTMMMMMNNGANQRGEDDTSSSKQPSLDHNEHNSKDQITQQIDSAPDSYSYETNTASFMKSTGNDKKMNIDGDANAQSMNEKSIQNGESEQKDDVSILDEEKDALTDLETLPESGTGGSITHENAAIE